MNKWLEVCKVITIIRVAHNYVLAAGGGDATHQSATITFGCDRYYPRPHLGCDGVRAVRATVIGNNYLTRNIKLLQRGLGLTYASCQSFGLVQTRHDDRQFQLANLGYCVRSVWLVGCWGNLHLHWKFSCQK